MKKDPLIITLVVLAIFVVLALVWQSIPAAREVTVDDYATDQHGSYLARWGVYYYEVIGTDTTLVDMDTTDSYGAYEITAPTGSYLIYAFPLWDDSTDTSLSRKSFMNLETIIAVDNDTTFFRFVKADSDFVGDITGNITGTADSAGVANTAWGPADDDWIVPDTSKAATLRATGNLAVGGDGGITGNLSVGDNAAITGDISCDDLTAADSVTIGGHVQIDSTLTVGVGGAGYDVNCYGDISGGRLFWDASKMALRTGIAEGDEWHEDSLGMYSFSVGRNNVAAGTSSVAMGEKCDARAPFSLAGGWRSIVKSSGDRSIAWGCESIASGYASTAFGFSDARGRYSVALGGTVVQKDFSVGMGYSTTVTGSLAVACGSGLLSQGNFSAALGYRSSALGDYSLTCGRYLMADSANTIVIGSGETFAKKLHNHTPNSIVLGMNSETATMTIKKDTTWIDSVLVVSDEIIGDLTGNATTASTCTIWTGSGTVNDTLAALRADVVNLDATVSTHGDSLTALTTDIAALQATKVDTNEAYVHRDAIDWTPESQLNASILKGNASAPWYSPTDTVVVDRFWVNYYGSAAGGEWEIILLNTSGDTISWTDTLTASGWQGYDDQSPSNTIITPADGFYLDVNEISGTTNLTRPSFRVEFYYTNP